MFKGRGKSLGFTEFLGWKHRIYTLFTPLEDRIGIVKAWGKPASFDIICGCFLYQRKNLCLKLSIITKVSDFDNNYPKNLLKY